MRPGLNTVVTLATLLISPHVIALEAQSTFLERCESSLPVQISKHFGLDITSHRLSLSLRASGYLYLTNKTGRTITSLVLVLDYFDSEGHDIFAIPYFGAPDNSPDQLSDVRPFVKTILNQPIKPNDKFVLSGSNLELTRVTPVSAEVAFVDVEFDDGTNMLLSESRAYVDPILLRTPDFFEVSSDPKIVPDDLFVVVTIDDRGRVVAVEPKQPESVPQSFFDQVKAQLQRWSFFPATRSGGAVQSRLNLRLDFRSATLPYPAVTCPLHFSDKFPATFVDVDLRNVEKDRWEIQYGGYHAGGKFHTIVSLGAKNSPLRR